MKRFKGLDLVDRMPEELWMKIRNIVQEAVTKTIPKKKKCKKAKWLSEEDLQIAEGRREAKGKRERERYTHLNAEFQRIARIGKTRVPFNKIGAIKGTFHARMGTIKNRNGKDLREAEEIKKRWQECTEELYKKVLNDLDNHSGVITYLEPDILEYKVK